MKVSEYLASVTDRLLNDTHVVGFHVIRQRLTETEGYLRARLTLNRDNSLEFSEYIRQTPESVVEIVTYSYHWADAHGNLILRWDNTPHYPDLPNFPHHIHEGTAESVLPGQPMSIFAVLDEITRRLS